MMCKITKRLLLAVMLIGSANTGWAQNEPATNSFNLEQCVNYALEHNELVKNAKLDREIANRRVGETLADGLPQINANLDLGYNYKVPLTQLPAILIPEGLRDPSIPIDGFIPVAFSTKYTGNAGITLNQMIFNGSYFVGLKAARTYTELSRKDQIKTETDVVEAVTKAYYTVLVNKERMDLIQQNFGRVDTLLRDTDALYQNGFVEKIDVNRVKVQFNNLKVEKDNIENLLQLSNDLLKFQMGMPIEHKIALSETINKLAFQRINESISKKYESRIEYSQLETQRDLLDLDIKNTNSNYYPKVDLYGSVGASAGTESGSDLVGFSKDPWFGLGTVGLRVSVPIFDGLRKSRQVQQKKIEATQIQHTFDQLKRSIDLEINQSVVTYNRSVDNMSAQKENMALAKEVFDVTKIKYEEGVGSNSEVLDADTALKQAQTNYYNALFDALVAKVDLQKAYGTLLKKDI